MNNPCLLKIYFLFIISSILIGCTQTESLPLATYTDLPAFTATPTEVSYTETPQPTFTPTPQKFFKDEFNQGFDNWTHFSINGKTSVINPGNIGARIAIEKGYFIFDIERKLFWVYSIYNQFTYDDVRIDVTVANRGTNNNNISIICRYSEEDGWYEFNITNSGLYYIYHALPRFDGFVAYTILGEGGSNEIRQGLETNVYTGICHENTLTLMVNDHFVSEVKTGRFDLTEGKIGISASTFLSVPVTAKFNDIIVSAP